jgi:hypothetical protein
LGALPGAVPSARLHARQIVWEWALTPLTEPVEHVVSELITNSGAPRGALSYPWRSREELEGGFWV